MRCPSSYGALRTNRFSIYHHLCHRVPWHPGGMWSFEPLLSSFTYHRSLKSMTWDSSTRNPSEKCKKWNNSWIFWLTSAPKKLCSILVFTVSKRWNEIPSIHSLHLQVWRICTFGCSSVELWPPRVKNRQKSPSLIDTLIIFGAPVQDPGIRIVEFWNHVYHIKSPQLENVSTRFLLIEVHDNHRADMRW